MDIAKKSFNAALLQIDLDCCRSYQPLEPAVMANSIAFEPFNHKVTRKFAITRREHSYKKSSAFNAGSLGCARDDSACIGHRLFLAFHKISGQFLERLRALAEGLELRKGIINQGVGFAERSIDAE